MYISHLSAQGFRNLSVEDIELAQGINILHGDNAQGKTNFLEAIYFCAFIRSLRGASDKELVNFNASSAKIRALLVRGGSPQVIDAYIEKSGARVTKSISIDRVPVRHMKDLFGRLLVVIFTPEDLRLIKSGPSERRRFMDMEICQISNVYYGDLREYHRVLKQRNALLKILQKDKSNEDSLDIWDEQLQRYGVRIIKTRAAFIERLSSISGEIHSNITQGNGSETLEIIYSPNITEPENYLRELQRWRKRDIMQGATSCGIHKDDLTFIINGIPARNFGSQGQQRTAALSAKLAEIEIIKQSTGDVPVLLLDDVFSELDAGRQKFLLSQIQDLQTLITCTGVDKVLEFGRCLCVEDGHVKRVIML